MFSKRILSGVLMLTIPVWLVGCGSRDAATPRPAGHFDGDGHDHSHDGHDHGKEPASAHHLGGWWCAEHGVPELECSQCDEKLVAAFKQKDDWCNAHDRAKSQCFICDPNLKDRFAALYKAKTGNDPPALTTP